MTGSGAERRSGRPAGEGGGREVLFEKSREEHRDAERDQPVECFGPTFENDEARRAHFRAPGRRPRIQGELPARTRRSCPVQQLRGALHNRTAFEDHDEPHLKRHLMRLWLMDWDGRPTVEGVRYHKGEGELCRRGAGSRIMRSGIRRLIRRSDGGRRYEVRHRRARYRTRGADALSPVRMRTPHVSFHCMRDCHVRPPRPSSDRPESVLRNQRQEFQ